MKILIVINDYLNKSNGMCISTQRFVKEFKKHGHVVRIITNNRYGEMDYALDVVKIPVFSSIIEKEGYTFAKVNKSVIKEAVEWADIVHLEDPFFVCRIAAIEATKIGKPVTGTFHMYPENMTYAIHMRQAHIMNFGFMRFFLRNVYNRCDYINCPTDIVKSRLERYRIRSQMITVSNGISKEFIGQRRTRKFDGTLNILSVGRFAVEKNQSLLIKAIAKCKNKENFRIILAGKGPLEKKLSKLATEYGLNIQMEFFEQSELKQIMLESDVYVHCASVEVEGMSCMEAFACGCVPIISDARLSSTKAFAINDDNIFEADNAESLANKIDYLYENPKILEKESLEYMEYAKQLDVSNCAMKLLDMMKNAIEERGKS